MDDFFLAFSSKALLKNFVLQSQVSHENKYISSIINIDGTYKFLLNGLILLVLGTKDLNHSFRLGSLAIVAHENEKVNCKFIESTIIAIQKNFDGFT